MDAKEAKKQAIEFLDKETDVLRRMDTVEKTTVKYVAVACLIGGAILFAVVYAFM